MGFQHLKKHPNKKFHVSDEILEKLTRMEPTERSRKIQEMAARYEVVPTAIYNLITRYKKKRYPELSALYRYRKDKIG